MAKRILVVAHDRPLRESRVLVLESQGYVVVSVETDDEAMRCLERERFDLILLGRKSMLPKIGIDQRIRERHPDLLTLKIEPAQDEHSLYPSRSVDQEPRHVLEAVRDMLGEVVSLVPVELAGRSVEGN